MSDDADKAAFIQMAHEVAALHRPKTEVYYAGLNPDWDGQETADLGEAMLRRERVVCSAGCGDYPCETAKIVLSG